MKQCKLLTLSFASSLFLLGIGVVAGRSANAATPEHTKKHKSSIHTGRASLRSSPKASIKTPVQENNFASSNPNPPKPTQLERVSLSYSDAGVSLNSLPLFRSQFAGKTAALSAKNEFVFFSIDPELQSFASQLVRNARVDHVAMVAMEPATGRILAIAGRSISLSNILFHAGFPAASLFKVITAAAALEKGQIQPDSLIRFRGGNYLLGKENYSPDSRRDNRTMSVTEALGRSCNPVFGRIALRFLNAPILRNYVQRFGFNSQLACDVTVTPSSAYIPEDSFELSRTGAGFGEVTISPIHAATMMAAVAHDGQLPRPIFVDRIVSPAGTILYRAKPTMLQQVIHPHTAETLLDMMEATTTIGTSKKEFMHRSQALNFRVAAKTGTLNGNNPKGLNNWFIAAAPLNNPKIAIAVITVNKRDANSKASHLGKMLLEKYFQG